MKKFFRLVSMLAVAGLTFAYTSCTDYSEDVNRLDKRIDDTLTSLDEQVKNLEGADKNLQSLIDAANTDIKALQDNTASLKEELTKLSEKHDADIKALSATHAADKAALEKALADKAAELKTALDNLNAEYTKKFSDLEAAYKQADVELKNQITQNSTKITTLEANVQNINEVVIPAVKQQIEDLAANVSETYATKVELTQATAEVTALINSEVEKLKASIKDVADRLTTLEEAHKTLKESFDETSAAQAASIAALETKVAALEAAHAADIETVKDLVKAAKEAAAAAKTAADAAQAAAAAAQNTANEAVNAAANAQTAADNAQKTASEALGNVNSLIDALGEYANEGALKNKIEELVNADIALALKDAELVAADAELTKKYQALAEKDAEFAQMIAGINEQLKKMGKEMSSQDSLLAENIKAAREDADKKVADAKEFVLNRIAELSEDLQLQVKEIYAQIAAEDKNLQQQIDELVEKKFNKADFAETFKTAYETRFDNDFKSAWDKKFQTAFDDAFKIAWDTKFQSAFDTAFAAVWPKVDSTFTSAINDAIATAIEDNGVVSNKINEKVNAAKKDLKDEISKLETEINKKLSALSTKVGDILLVVGDLAERIQSITFVPEYDDFCATLYYYMYPIVIDAEYQKGIPVSDKKTVVAKFEVYPKSQAAKVAEMLKSSEGASLVAVPLKSSYTRGAAEATKAEIIKAEAENGVVSIVGVFGAEVNYYFDDVNPEKDAVSFAISLRVDSAAETEVRDGEASKSIVTGNRIESAYVPVQLSGNSWVRGFCLYDFVNEKFFEDTSVERQWSAAPAKWNYFVNDDYSYDFAVIMYDRDGKECVKNLDEAAEYMNIDVEDITPSFTVNAVVDKKDAEKFFDPKAEKNVVKFDDLADCYIAMNETAVKANVEKAVGRTMTHCIDFVIDKLGTVCHYDLNYTIIRRQVNFNLKPYDSNEIDWTYAKAYELTKNTKSGIAYDKDIIFNECNVVRGDDNEEVPAKLGEILEKDPKFTVTINGVEQTVNKTPIKIEVVAQDAADVAKVTIPGRTYTFAQGVDNIYEITATYAVDGEFQTDYNVSFNYTLGGMPKDQTVTLPAKKINFKSGETFFTGEYDEKDYISQLTVAPYFNDAKELWTSVNEDKFKQDVVYYKNKSEFVPATNSSTYLNVLADGVSAVIDKMDIDSFDDNFGFKVTRKTWYGVKYTFTTGETGVRIDRPVFSLAPAADRLNDDWTGKIDHEAKYDKYVLKQDIDLSKYVTVANYDKKETELTITYDQETVADAANGIVNVPVINTTKVAVIPNAAAPDFPTIESSFINWLTWSTSDKRGTSFTAREDRIKAVLKLDGIVLDSKIMTLSTDCPITKFAFDNFVETIPEGSTSTTVKLWNNMIIEGVLEEGNIAKQDASSLTGAIYGTVKGKKSNPNTYDCEVIFPDKKNVEVYVGGVKQNIYNQEKFTYDPAKGTITFTGDLADLVKPVEFKFKATLNYVLDRVHMDYLETDVSVTFQK